MPAVGNYILSMNDRIKRPPTVWLAQALLIIFALLGTTSLALNLATLVEGDGSVSPTRATIGLSVILGFVLLLLAACWGLAKAKVYGRWLGIIALVLVWGLILYTQIRPPTGPLKRYEYNSPAERVGAISMQVFISALFLTLIFRLAWAKGVREFFRR
jgi:hypothetical protein